MSLLNVNIVKLMFTLEMKEMACPDLNAMICFLKQTKHIRKHKCT